MTNQQIEGSSSKIESESDLTRRGYVKHDVSASEIPYVYCEDIKRYFECEGYSLDTPGELDLFRFGNLSRRGLIGLLGIKTCQKELIGRVVLHPEIRRPDLIWLNVLNQERLEDFEKMGYDISKRFHIKVKIGAFIGNQLYQKEIS